MTETITRPAYELKSGDMAWIYGAWREVFDAVPLVGPRTRVIWIEQRSRGDVLCSRVVNEDTPYATQ